MSASDVRKTKQVGIRLPVDLWERALVVAASRGQRPGAFVAGVLERAVAEGERALQLRLEKRDTKAAETSSAERRRRAAK